MRYLHLHISELCAAKKKLTMIPQHNVSVAQTLYKCWNIHIQAYFSLHFFCPFSKRNIFLHFRVCYIYEESRACVPKAAQWLISGSYCGEETSQRPHTCCNTHIERCACKCEGRRETSEEILEIKTISDMKKVKSFYQIQSQIYW